MPKLFVSDSMTPKARAYCLSLGGRPAQTIGTPCFNEHMIIDPVRCAAYVKTLGEAHLRAIAFDIESKPESDALFAAMIFGTKRQQARAAIPFLKLIEAVRQVTTAKLGFYGIPWYYHTPLMLDAVDYVVTSAYCTETPEWLRSDPSGTDHYQERLDIETAKVRDAKVSGKPVMAFVDHRFTEYAHPLPKEPTFGGRIAPLRLVGEQQYIDMVKAISEADYTWQWWDEPSYWWCANQKGDGSWDANTELVIQIMNQVKAEELPIGMDQEAWLTATQIRYLTLLQKLGRV